MPKQLYTIQLTLDQDQISHLSTALAQRLDQVKGITGSGDEVYEAEVNHIRSFLYGLRHELYDLIHPTTKAPNFKIIKVISK